MAHAVVPGFERFHAADGGDAAKGGQLLLGELNCTSCHTPADAEKTFVQPKPAPHLHDVGTRVKRTYLRKFLTDPHATKPGTTMPDVFAGLPEAERKEKVEALVHLLAATGTLHHARPKKNLAAAGREVYHKIGCVACHGSRDAKGDPENVLKTSVPLGDLAAKYTVHSLSVFLANPLHSRPGGRMPGLLDANEAQQVAQYLLQSIPSPPGNVTFAYYEGDWSNLPDFGSLTPQYQGTAHGFDLSVARRQQSFALTFDGYLKIDRDGDYQFLIASDDGSRLVIDGKTVVENDGVHPTTQKSGRILLKKGMHKVHVAYFQGPGEAVLRVEMQGPGVAKQALDSLLTLTEKGNASQTVQPGKQADDESFTVDPTLVAKGRQVFASAGCASCHPLSIGGKAITSTLTAKPLAQLQPAGGCLADAPAKGVPHYALSGAQQKALSVAIKGLTRLRGEAPDAKQRIVRTMTALNCYACHDRDKVGGVEPQLDRFFTTTQPEMGDEGRIPPSLNRVGAKLNKSYFQKILANGSDDRPYMHTRMPRFGLDNAGHLVDDFAKLDSLPAVAKVDFGTLADRQVKSVGRHLVGVKGLGCIKCHTFAGHKAEGVQGIDMTIMTQRVQHDWFHQYLIDPQKFRPGTRMPTAWPGGQSLLVELGGDTNKQIEAIWQYLSEAKMARLPVGLATKFIELVPEKEAIIYRNFIAGGGPRAIGVGYPERGNLVFDANNLRLAMIWQGAFIDASKHWVDRGAGFQGPLGDNVLSFPDGPSFAVLAKEDSPWPAPPAKTLGFKFEGYRLSKDQRPTFLYSFQGVAIEDFPTPIDKNGKVEMVRRLTVTGEQRNLYYRAAVGKKIEAQGDGWYHVNGTWRTKVESAAMPQLRQSGGNMELLVPVRFADRKASIVQQIAW